MAEKSGGVYMEWNDAALTGLLNSREVVNFVHGTAQSVAATARALAGTIAQTGKLQASIHVVDEKHPTRPASLVVADVPYAAKIESKYGILRRAKNANRIG